MAKKAKQKYYVVWKWKKPGIFTTRDDCKASVHWFIDAEYKSFKNLAEAEIAFSWRYKDFVGQKTTWKDYSPSEKKEIWSPVTSSLSVDAACSNNPGILEFRWVLTSSRKQVFAYGPYDNWTVNIWEFLALIEWLKYAKDHNINLIYTDSKTARARLRDRKVKTTLTPSLSNKILFDRVDKSLERLNKNDISAIEVRKRYTDLRGEIPADYDRK